MISRMLDPTIQNGVTFWNRTQVSPICLSAQRDETLTDEGTSKEGACRKWICCARGERSFVWLRKSRSKKTRNVERCRASDGVAGERLTVLASSPSIVPGRRQISIPKLMVRLFRMSSTAVTGL